MHLPLSLYPDATLDDSLFSNLGESIINGHWLGSFNSATLAKGPSFPIFLAVNSILGIPITLSLALFYAFSCWLVVRSLISIGLNSWWGLVIFVALLFHPYILPMNVLRDFTYPALSLILISGVIALIKGNYANQKNFFFYGLAFGFFWLTREEGVWVLPGIISTLLIRAYLIRGDREKIILLGRSFAMILIGCFIYIGSIATINFFKYGSFETVDFKNRAFSGALDNLYRVNVGPEVEFLPVPSKKREAIYNVSPAFAKLRGYFDGPGMGWTIHGCNYYPHTCGDIAAGWVMWALRAAVEFNGLYKSPKLAEDFYKQLNLEIESACSSGALKCESRIVPFVPLLTLNQMQKVPSEILKIIKLSLVMEQIRHSGGPSNDPVSRLNKLRLFLGNPKTLPSLNEEAALSPVLITGWFRSNSDLFWPHIECFGYQAYSKKIDRLPSLDVAEHFKDPQAGKNRFSISLASTQAKDCVFLDGVSRLKEEGVSIDKIISEDTRLFTTKSGGVLAIDQLVIQDPLKPYLLPLRVKRILADTYSYFVPFMALIGLLCFPLGLIRKIKYKIGNTNLLLIAGMCWAMLCTRVLLLAIIEISSFPVRTVSYMSAGFSLVILASLLSITQAYNLGITRVDNYRM